MLSQSDVVPYLLDGGVIQSSAVVHGRMRVVDASRRNQVFVVTSEKSPAYVVKQPRSRDDPAVSREAAVLRGLADGDARAALQHLLPVVVAYDAREQIVVLETEADARDFRSHYAKGRFSVALARASGRALARLHHAPADAVGARPAGLDPAWPLSWYAPPIEQLFEFSGAGVELLRLVQGSRTLTDGLDDLRESWRADSLIHGDARWDNWLALEAPTSRRRTRVVMIDWELAGGGDPCLDLGAVLGEYLISWLDSIPVVDTRDPGRLVRHARRPLSRMRPAMRAFWAAYLDASGRDAEKRSLRRAVRFAGVRLLQSAAERAQDASELRAGIVHALQLGANLIGRPDEATLRLLGSPWPPEAT